MIVLDTNVVSEIMRNQPRTEVLVWIDQRASRELFVTAVTEAEVLAGIALLMLQNVRSAVCPPGRVLPVDSLAARAYS